jgi:hypothetical protein
MMQFTSFFDACVWESTILEIYVLSFLFKKKRRKKTLASETMTEYFHLLRRETKLSRLVKPFIDETGSDNVSRSILCDENIPGVIVSEAKNEVDAIPPIFVLRLL